MQTFLAYGLIAIVIFGLGWIALRQTKKLGKAEVVTKGAEATADLARRQDAAGAQRPRTDAELDDRLRNKGGL